MRNRTIQRRGVTLLELLAVVTLLGIFAAVAITRYGRSVFGDFGSQAGARTLSLALLQTQRTAITSGDNHFLEFNAATATSYSLQQRTGTGTVLIDGPHDLSSDMQVVVSHTVMEFTFEGQALAPYVITIAGENREWQVDVIPISGAIRVTETTP